MTVHAPQAALGQSLKSFDHKTNVHKVHMHGVLAPVQTPGSWGGPDPGDLGWGVQTLGTWGGPDPGDLVGAQTHCRKFPDQHQGGAGEGVEPGGGTVLKVSGGSLRVSGGL